MELLDFLLGCFSSLFKLVYQTLLLLNFVFKLLYLKRLGLEIRGQLSYLLFPLETGTG
jgi:hypothetical protein